MATVAHPSAVERTVQKTHGWLNEIAQELGVDDQRAAYHALRSVLHALRDRLSIEHAVGLGAQLPMLIRGMYYEGWRPRDKPAKIRDGSEFEGMIAADLISEGWPGLEADRAAVAVYHVLEHELDPGEIDKVVHTLPLEVRGVLGVDAVPCGDVNTASWPNTHE